MIKYSGAKTGTNRALAPAFSPTESPTDFAFDEGARTRFVLPMDNRHDDDDNERRFKRMLEVDRFRQERWKVEVFTPHQMSWDAQKTAMRFAEIAIQAAFLVNGGALIAVPPLMDWLSKSARSEVPIDASAFVVGLIFAAATASTAYFNFLSLAAFLAGISDRRALELQEEFHGAGQVSAADMNAAKSRISRNGRFVKTTQIAAIILCTLSYVAFGAGAYTFIHLAEHSGDFSDHSSKSGK